MKCVQLKDSLSPRVTRSALHKPPQPLDLHSFTPERKTEKKCAGQQLFTSEVTRILHVHRATEWPPTRFTPPRTTRNPKPCLLCWRFDMQTVTQRSGRCDTVRWNYLDADKRNAPENLFPRPPTSSPETQRNIVSERWWERGFMFLFSNSFLQHQNSDHKYTQNPKSYRQKIRLQFCMLFLLTQAHHTSKLIINHLLQ